MKCIRSIISSFRNIDLLYVYKETKHESCTKQRHGLLHHPCYHTEYSSDIFRIITAFCFLSLAVLQCLYAIKVLNDNCDQLCILNYIMGIGPSYGRKEVRSVHAHVTQSHSDCQWRVVIFFLQSIFLSNFGHDWIL